MFWSFGRKSVEILWHLRPSDRKAFKKVVLCPSGLKGSRSFFVPFGAKIEKHVGFFDPSGPNNSKEMVLGPTGPKHFKKQCFLGPQATSNKQHTISNKHQATSHQQQEQEPPHNFQNSLNPQGPFLQNSYFLDGGNPPGTKVLAILKISEFSRLVDR